MEADFDTLRESSVIPGTTRYPGRLRAGLDGVERAEEAAMVRAHIVQLSKGERRALHSRYRRDFDLFGYHPEVW